MYPFPVHVMRRFLRRFRFCTRSINGGQCGWHISGVNLKNPGLGENRAKRIEEEHEGESIFEMKSVKREMAKE
jgi:hypothetical protein